MALIERHKCLHILIFSCCQLSRVLSLEDTEATCPSEQFPTNDYGIFEFPETKATQNGIVVTSPCPFGFQSNGVEPIDPEQNTIFEEVKTQAEEQSGAKRICFLKANGSGEWEPFADVTVDRCRNVKAHNTAVQVEKELAEWILNPNLNGFKNILPILVSLSNFATTDYECAVTLVDGIANMIPILIHDEEGFNYATALINIIETYALNAEINPGYRVKIRNEKIAVETVQLPYTLFDVSDVNVKKSVKDYSSEIDNVQIKFPAEAIQKSMNQKILPKLKITAYSDDLFSHWKETASNETELYDDSEHNVTVGNWRVLSVEMKDVLIKDLESEFEFTFFPNKSTTKGYQWRCVYWCEKDKRWSEEGMTSVVMENSIVCKSSHLTAFSLLIDPLPLPFPGSDYAPINNTVHAHILSILSSLGSAISIVGLAGTILTYGLFRTLRRERSNRLLINLSISLLLLHLLSISSTKSFWHDKCLIPSALLHYFLHTSMFWMLMESYHLYELLISVFVKPESRFLLKRSLVAWGVPMIIVGICAAVDLEVYTAGRNDVCIIAAHLNLILYYTAYLAPTIIILLINLFVFCRIFNVLYKQTARQRKQSQVGPKNSVHIRQGKAKGDLKGTKVDKKSKTQYVMLSPTQIKGALTVMILVGVGWIVGLFAIGPFEVFFKYLFAICNAGQGAFIFIFRVLLHPQACREWRKAILGFTFDSTEVSTTSSTNVSKERKKQSFSVSPTFISASNSVENSLTPSDPAAQDLANTLANMLRNSEGQPQPRNPL